MQRNTFSEATLFRWVPKIWIDFSNIPRGNLKPHQALCILRIFSASEIYPPPFLPLHQRSALSGADYQSTPHRHRRNNDSISCQTPLDRRLKRLAHMSRSDDLIGTQCEIPGL